MANDSFFEEVNFRGHLIMIEVRNFGRLCQWAYRIDDGNVHFCKDRGMPTQSEARDEALEDAKWRIIHKVID